MYKNVAIYVRQSIDNSEGIDRQLARCRDLVASRGWTEGPVFQDNATSATKDRGKNTAWSKMIAAIERGEVTVVVAVNIDRLLRRLRDITVLTDLQVKLITVDGDIDLTTADGEFRAAMLASMASFETRRKSERQLSANAHRHSLNMPSAGGRRRFGFENDHMTLIPGEAEWVRMMYQDVADGATLGSICRKMNTAGVECVTTGLWNPARIRKILLNPAYRGNLIRHKEAVPSILVPVVIEAELAGRVDAIMADPTRRKSAGNERSALMGGIAVCGTCGARLVSAGTKSNGKAIQTYSCCRVKSGQTAHAGHPSIRRRILDSIVRKEIVHAFIFGRDAINSLSLTDNLPAIEASLAKLHNAQANVTDMMIAELITADVARGRLTAIKREIDELSRQRTELVTKDAYAKMLVDTQRSFYAPGLVDMEKASELLTLVSERFDSLELGMKRELIQTLLDVSVTVGRGAKRVSIRHKVVTSLNDDQNTAE